jgi:hypothetical protein
VAGVRPVGAVIDGSTRGDPFPISAYWRTTELLMNSGNQPIPRVENPFSRERADTVG